MDHGYKMVKNALVEIESVDPETEAELDDVIVEPPCYTNELLDFISANLINYSYIQEAINEFGVSEKEDVLSPAYYLAQREVTDLVVSLVNEISDELDQE